MRTPPLGAAGHSFAPDGLSNEPVGVGGGKGRGSQKNEENKKMCEMGERNARGERDSARVCVSQWRERGPVGSDWGGTGGRLFVGAQRDCMGRFLRVPCSLAEMAVTSLSLLSGKDH